MTGKLYPLRHGQGYFDVGVIAEGLQAIVHHGVSDLLLLRFNRVGKYLGHGRSKMKVAPAGTPGSGTVGDAVFWNQVRHEMVALKPRLVFTPQDIAVQKFADDEVYSGIEEMPFEYEEFQKAPMSALEEDRAEIERSIREWRAMDCFVLEVFGGEYWMSATGEVQSHW